MAAQQNHVSFSFVIALAYSLIGVLVFDMSLERVVLAAVVIMLAGLLPNIDGGTEPPAKELGGILSSALPVFLIYKFPKLNQEGSGRITLVVVGCYFATRFIVSRVLQKFTFRRGMIHSVPAAIILGELTYFAYYSLVSRERVFIAIAAFAGFMSHLFLDGYGNFDLVSQVSGKAPKKQSCVKFLAPSFTHTAIIWTIAVWLGWIIAKDFYPNLGARTPIVY